jgi:hypothetical protein
MQMTDQNERKTGTLANTVSIVCAMTATHSAAPATICLLGSFQKTKGVRPHHHRATTGGGVNQVLADLRLKAPTQKTTSACP